MPRIRRKTFAAREDLLNRISELAKQKGYTLYDEINEIFELAIKAEYSGVSIWRITETLELLNTIKNVCFIPCSEMLWYEINEIAYRTARDEAKKRWFEAGVWLANLYEASGAHNPYETLMKDLKSFMWSTPEFDVKTVEDKVSIRILNPAFTEAYADLLASFLEGMLETLNYEIERRESKAGAIRLEAARREENG